MASDIHTYTHIVIYKYIYTYIRIHTHIYIHIVGYGEAMRHAGQDSLAWPVYARARERQIDG
jgi:hypothetical protein